MKWRPALLALCVSCVATGTPALAGIVEGQWIGGFRDSDGWVYLQVRFGGEGADMTGRADLPVNGEEAILLRHVRAAGGRVTFEIPGMGADLVFDGTAKGRDRLAGSVRQGWGRSSFELLRAKTLSPRQLDDLSGEYQGKSPRDVVLVYVGPFGLSYVDYATGRMGRLIALSDGRFVSGPSVLAGFPIELTMTPEQRGTEVIGLSWRREGEDARTLRRISSYRTQKITVRSTGDVTLSGMLLLPNTPVRHPAVVLVPGSGRITADALLPYADSLARSGVAVLIHDKRGVGASTGVHARAGIAELADDALAGVAWLKGHPAIDPRQIGLVGTSLGGWVAPLAATRSDDVAFLIMEAAPAITPAAHERLRVQNQMRADRMRPEAITEALTFMDRKFEVGRSGEGWDELQVMAERGEREGWLRYVNRPLSLESMRWNWEHVLSYDPAPVLKQLRIPVLAIYGGLDRIVEPGFNSTVMEQALQAAGNADVTVRTFPNANHNFFEAVTGGPGEASRLKSFVPGYFEARVAWLMDRVDMGATSTAAVEPTQTLDDIGAMALLTKAPLFLRQ